MTTPSTRKPTKQEANQTLKRPIHTHSLLVLDMLRIVNPRYSKTVVARTTAMKAVASYQFNLPKTFHNSVRAENELIIGGLGVLGAAMTLKYTLQAYDSYAQKRASQPADAAQAKDNQKDSTQADTADATHASSAKETEPEAEAEASTAKAEPKMKAAPASPGFFANWTNAWFAKNFYDGGFEDKMTKREAALILGVRESATPERVKDAHRRIMQINHPDKGGSAYLTAKVNEAKDLLLKGKN